MSPLKVEVDWDNDGTFSAPGADISDLVRPVTGAITAQYGRDQSTALAPAMSGQGQVVLDNRDRRFTPRNTASPLYGKVKPARPVRIRRTVPGVPVPAGYPGDVYPSLDLYPSTGGSTAADVSYTLFVGHTDDSPINPDLNSRTVSLSLLDSLAALRGQSISTPLYSGIRTGDAVNYILDVAGWPAELRDIDSGATVIPWWWEDDTDMMDALEKVVRSEGPPAVVTVGSSGEIIFRDRHHRLTEARTLTPQSVWRGSEGRGEPVMSVPFSYDEAWRNIVNSGTVSVDVRTVQPLQAVWTSDATISLSAGEERIINASASDPFYDAVTPADGVDLTTKSGSVTVRLMRTSGVSVGIVLAAVGGDAIISNLRLWAYPVTSAYTVQVSASDSQSVAEFGARSFQGDLPWCSEYDAAAVLSTVVSQRAHPLPVVTARFVVGRNGPRAGAILPRDLSDRVTVVESETMLDDDFYIESIQHELTSDVDHAVTFGLEACPIPVTPVMRFDTAGQGFGTGKFGSGLDDPATMFRFDGIVGHRFDSGVFAT